jgi:DNA replication protein DnaC
VADVLRAIRSCFDKKGQTEDEVIQSFISPQVLVLDDLGKERPTEWALEQLFAVINARYDACKPLIVTTNYGGTDLVRRLTPKGETDDTTARAIVDRLRETSIVIKLEGKSWR